MREAKGEVRPFTELVVRFPSWAKRSEHWAGSSFVGIARSGSRGGNIAPVERFDALRISRMATASVPRGARIMRQLRAAAVAACGAFAVSAAAAGATPATVHTQRYLASIVGKPALLLDFLTR